jgi:hypothetical protein
MGAVEVGWGAFEAGAWGWVVARAVPVAAVRMVAVAMAVGMRCFARMGFLSGVSGVTSGR